MSKKTGNNNKLPYNLPQLQNLIKRDGDSYRDEFQQQYRHYQSHLEVFRLKPSKYIKTLDELVMFFAQIAQCYRAELSTYPQEICDILQSHGVVIDASMRLTLVKALILLRSKGLIPATTVFELFFKLFRCKDKLLRKTLFDFIINDIKNINLKHQDAKLNSTLQNYILTMLSDNNHTAAKMSLDVMIYLYRKNIWNNTKVVNVVATGCLSKVTKIVVASLKFFLGHNEESDDESDDEETKKKDPDVKKTKKNLKIGKSTRKRRRQMEKELKVKKAKTKEHKPESFNFSALHLLHDPQDFAEKLFSKLQTTNERFEVKIMMMDLISRLIGIHQLILCNFYSFLQKYLNPRQKEVTKLLLFAAQASHPLVPPDLIEEMLKTIANNFVTERNMNDAITVGLNATKEVCARCPLAMTEELLQDLIQYKSHRVKAVTGAARSLLHYFREADPEKLRRKDRGKPTGNNSIVRPYGEVNVVDNIPGAEDLSGSSDDYSSDDDVDDAGADNKTEDENFTKLTESNTLEPGEDDAKDDDVKGEDDVKDVSTVEIQKLKAQDILSSRILTQADFKNLKKRQMLQQLQDQGPRKGKKRKIDAPSSGELPSLANIEHIGSGKHFKDKDAKIEKEAKEKGTYHRERTNPFASTTNKEKNKHKNYVMLRPKSNQRRNKRSFREKQVLLRNALLKRAKLKRKKKI